MEDNKNSTNQNIDILAKGASPTKIAKLLESWPINKKIIFLILGLVALFEIILMVRSVVIKPPVPVVQRPQVVAGAKIVLDSPKTNYQVGDDVMIVVRVATGGHTTDGVDLIMHYDNKVLEATGSGIFTPGKIYTEYPPTIINNNKGEIRVSGLTGSEANSFIGVGNFGQIKLKAIANGSTKISADFRKAGATVDTNVTETKTAKDLLEKVYDLNISIGSISSNDTQKTTTSSCQEYVQICQNDQGHQGTQICSQGVKNNGLCSWDPYLTLTCTQCQISKGQNH